MRAIPLLDRAQLGCDKTQRLFATRLAELAAFADQRLLQPVLMVHIIPPELALNARRNLVGVAMQRCNLEDFAVLGPDIIAAPNAAIGADRLRLLDALFAHLRLGLSPLHDGPLPHLPLNTLAHLDHLVPR